MTGRRFMSRTMSLTFFQSSISKEVTHNPSSSGDHHPMLAGV
jgi:hypothetical protein